MSLFTIIMLASFAIVPLISLIFLLNETKPKKNIVIGVTLPNEALADEEIKSELSRYRLFMLAVTVISVLLLVPLAFIKGMGLMMTILLSWLLLYLIALGVVYAVFNTRLRRIKKQRRYLIVSSSERVFDPGIRRGLKPQMSRLWFLPPVIICFVPVLLSYLLRPQEELLGYLILGASFASVAVLGFFLYPVIYRQRMDVVGSDTALNTVLSNVRLMGWARMWLWLSWGMAVYAVLAWVSIYKPIVFGIITAVFTGFILCLAVYVEMTVRREQESLQKKAGDEYVDDDAHWIFGMFYYNPQDRHYFINNRVGINMGVNLGRPAGMITMVVLLLLLLAMPLIGVYMMKIEAEPRVAEYTGEAVSIIHVNEQFRVKYSEIEEIKLLEKLPQISRIAGTGLENLAEGRYNIEGFGSGKICLNPNLPPFVLIKTHDGLYMFNLMTESATKDAFMRIKTGPVGIAPAA